MINNMQRAIILKKLVIDIETKDQNYAFLISMARTSDA